MNNWEIEERFEGWLNSEANRCYDDKQAEYDYNGATAFDEDTADWFKPKYLGGGKKL